MILKRAPLFIAGLIYGIVLNCTVLGLAYGIVGIGYGIYGLCRLAFESGGAGDCCIAFAEDGLAFSIIIGAILAAAGAVGLVVGVGYGLTFGTWHCAMDFYNNGIKQGLTSPFRFLSAHWEKNWKNNPAPLKTYYESTEIGFLERKAAAKEIILDQAEYLHSTLTEINQFFPPALSKEIAMYSVDPKECKLPETHQPSALARRIENLSLPESENKSEAKPELSKTAAGYLTDEEAIEIIRKNGFFGSRKLNNPAPMARPLPNPLPL